MPPGAATNRRALGAYYTAPDMAERITRRALGFVADADPYIVDPACGDGVFLRALAAARARRLYGIDLDPDALTRARELQPSEPAILAHGDALISEPLPGIESLDWRARFPEVFARGGFDLVIGNPPFRTIDAMVSGDDPERFRVCKTHFQEFASDDPQRISWSRHYRRMCDLFHLFFVRGLWALRPGGVLAFLTSRTWLEAWYADRLREHLARTATILAIDDLGDDVRAFQDVALPATVVYLRKSRPAAEHRIAVTVNGEPSTVAQAGLGSAPWRLRHQAVPGSVRLGELCELSQGMQTGANPVLGALTAETIAGAGIEAAALRRRAVGVDIRPGQLTETKPRWVLWTEPFQESSLPPGAAAWLRRHRGRLEARAAFRRGDCAWFRWTWPRPGLVDVPKLLCPYRAASNRFWYDAEGETIGLTDTTALVPRADMPITPGELEAVLNNAEHTRRQLAMAKPTGGGMFEYFANQLRELPVSW